MDSGIGTPDVPIRRAFSVPHSGKEIPHRSYRRTMGARFHHFLTSYRETDLWIGINPGPVSPMLEASALNLARNIRFTLDSWALSHPGFLESLDPLPDDPEAPTIVRKMLAAGISAGVGPMAAVAGAVAQEIGETLHELFSLREIIVENGGDVWMRYLEPLDVAVEAGASPLSGRIGFRLPAGFSPCSVCTSSGTTGLSLSFGMADAAMVVAREGSIADAWATAAGNMIRGLEDIETALSEIFNEKGSGDRPDMNPLAAIIVVGDRMGIRGSLSLRESLPLRVFS